MTSLPAVFSTPTAFKAAFNQGLENLLDINTAGTFILACANASQHPGIFNQYRQPLHAVFDTLKQRYQAVLRSGQSPLDAEDDVIVMLKLFAVDIEHLTLCETRQLGPWEVQFNHLRSFRPQRMTAHTAESLSLPYRADGFNFNKTFLQKEIFWQGKLAGRDVSLFYNKFPFVDYHGLFVPEQQRNLPQFLTRTMHEYVWHTCQLLQQNLPGIGFAYNSLGAFASVNHLHFQLYLREQPLPVLNMCWQHNGGDQVYPTPCYRFDSAAESWPLIMHLHETETPYNLIYADQAIYCLPRATQGSYEMPAWSSGFAWYEMAGGIITFNRDHYQQLSENQIKDALSEAGSVISVPVPAASDYSGDSAPGPSDIRK